MVKIVQMAKGYTFCHIKFVKTVQLSNSKHF